MTTFIIITFMFVLGVEKYKQTQDTKQKSKIEVKRKCEQQQ